MSLRLFSNPSAINVKNLEINNNADIQNNLNFYYELPSLT